ncbi:MAG: hypothetical protein AAF678_10915 [Pseudomonadota bacterium]
MIATAAFFVFGGLLVGGACLTAATPRRFLAGLGFVTAALGVSGLCVLLDAPALGFGLLAVSLATISGLYLYLSNERVTTRSVQSRHRRSFLGASALIAVVVVLQLALAGFDVRLINPNGSDVAGAETDVAASETAGGVATAFDVTLIVFAGLLIFAGFVSIWSLMQSGNGDAKVTRTARPLSRQGNGAVQRRTG